VPASVDRVFSSSDRSAIEAAVREAETRSPGEIVPYAVDRSDAYAEGTWAAATFGAMLGGLAAALLHVVPTAWGEAPPQWGAGLPALGAALGYVLGVAWPAFRLRLVPAHTVAHRVQQRAVAAFVEQEVFLTEARTGILIFVSLLERRVLVLGDSGINARVAQNDWDAIVALVVGGMRRGEPGSALAAAIRRAGDLLAAHDLRRRPDDRDELPDELRRRPE
jgi:putative membrane protein